MHNCRVNIKLINIQLSPKSSFAARAARKQLLALTDISMCYHWHGSCPSSAFLPGTTNKRLLVERLSPHKAGVVPQFLKIFWKLDGVLCHKQHLRLERALLSHLCYRIVLIPILLRQKTPHGEVGRAWSLAGQGC